MGGSKNNDEESLLEAIKFYQDGLIRYLQRNDENKMSHGLNKLSSYPIRVSHLQDTGVGRTVNMLVNKEGKVGEQARSLIEKWKKMVEKEEQKHKLDSYHQSSQASPQSEGISDECDSSPEKSCSDENNSNDEEQHSSSKSQKKGKVESNRESSASDEERRHKSSIDIRRKSYHDPEDAKKQKLKEKDHSHHRKDHASSRHEKDVSSKNSSQHEKQRSSKREREHSSRTENRDSSKHNDVEHSSRHGKENSSKHDRKERHETENKSDDSAKRKDDKSDRKKERSHHGRNDKLENKERSDIDRSKRSHQEKHERQKKEQRNESVTKGKENSSKDGDERSSSSKIKVETKPNKNLNTEISSGSGTSFEEALGLMGMPRKEKKSHSKEKTSSSAHHKNESSKSSSDITKTSKSNNQSKSDKKSNFKHDESGKTENGVLKKDRKQENRDKSSSSKRNKDEIPSGSGTSFEDALGMIELPKKEKKLKRKTEPETCVGYEESEICSSSGTTFEEALGMIETPRKKKKLTDQPMARSPSPVENDSIAVPLPNVPLDKIELISHLPPITPNYKPIRLPESPHTHNDVSFMDTLMKNKYHRTKIYSGNKNTYNKVPSLLESCINLLKVHIDDIEATGGVPYSILKPVLEKANPTQLLRLEYYNSYLTEDTDELWKLHCQKDFRNKSRQECETWREMYTRCTEEREARFLTLTASIKESKQKSLPVRTTKVAYIVPPMSGPRRQIRNSSAPMAKAKAEAITRESMSTSDVVVNHQRKASRSQPAPSVSSQAKVKKMAPLMAKSLSAFKNRRFK